MKRLLPILAMALLGLSGCDSGTVVSPLAPEVGQASFAKAVLPEFEPATECPEGKTCLVGPIPLERGPGAPSLWVSDPFEATEGQEALLVVQTSNPKTTTMKAWLNGATVLLPSVIPQWGESQVSVPITLAETNVLEVRLSAKPGTQVAFWVEVEAVAPAGGEEPPPPDNIFPFAVTAGQQAATDDRGAACGLLGDYEPADWNDVLAATEHWEALSVLLGSGMAWILVDGVSGFQTTTFFTTTDFYYLVFGDADMAAPYEVNQFVGENTVLLVDASLAELFDNTQHPVLYVSTS